MYNFHSKSIVKCRSVTNLHEILMELTRSRHQSLETITFTSKTVIFVARIVLEMCRTFAFDNRVRIDILM